MRSSVSVQVFATDINEAAIEKARRGAYIENIATDVSAERLARFFTRAGTEFQVGRRVPDLCVFSRHDLLTDPAFSQMDLVSCRNVLIYLDSVARTGVSTAAISAAGVTVPAGATAGAPPTVRRRLQKPRSGFLRIGRQLPSAGPRVTGDHSADSKGRDQERQLSHATALARLEPALARRSSAGGIGASRSCRYECHGANLCSRPARG
jgi:hypothetical protein